MGEEEEKVVDLEKETAIYGKSGWGLKIGEIVRGVGVVFERAHGAVYLHPWASDEGVSVVRKTEQSGSTPPAKQT